MNLLHLLPSRKRQREDSSDEDGSVDDHADQLRQRDDSSDDEGSVEDRADQLEKRPDLEVSVGGTMYLPNGMQILNDDESSNGSSDLGDSGQRYFGNADDVDQDDETDEEVAPTQMESSEETEDQEDHVAPMLLDDGSQQAPEPDDNGGNGDEQEQEQNENGDGIEFEERNDVDGIFEGFATGSVLVVAFAHARHAFFSYDVRADDGALRRKVKGTAEYKRFIQGKEGYVFKEFSKKQLADAKAFAQNPRAALDTRNDKSEQTKQRKQQKTNETEARRNQESRPSNEDESFWKDEYKDVYKAIPLPEEDYDDDVVEKVGELFDNEKCDARALEPKKNMFKKDITDNHKTFAFRVVNKFTTKDQREALRSLSRVHRQVYNATVAYLKRRNRQIRARPPDDEEQNNEETNDEETEEDGDEVEPETDEEQNDADFFAVLRNKKRVRRKVFGLENDDITWGMSNCAWHIPTRTLSLAEMTDCIRDSWKSVPYAVKEDAVNQALMAYETNFAKRKKQRERNEEVKPFTVKFRKYGQNFVINLPKRKVLLDFVQTEKKNFKKPKNKPKKQKKQKNQNKKEKKKKKKKKKRKAKNKRTRDAPVGEHKNDKVHFFARFSAHGVRLCSSPKVANQVLHNESEDVVQTQIRYNQKTRQYFINAVVKCDRTKPDKSGKKIVAAVDLGINPLYTVYTSEGKTLTEDKDDRKMIFKMKDDIEKLETRIRKREYKPTNGRTKKQYAGTTKRLKLKLERMRVKLKNFRTMWQHKEAKKIVDAGDVIIWNSLRMQQILKDSKSEYKKLNPTARRNASVAAPGMLTEKMMWQVRKTEGKKFVTGEGEKGTSKTCSKCGWWKPGLRGDKTYVCENPECLYEGNRDVLGARNNLLEKLQQIWGGFVGWFQDHVLQN